MEYIEKELGYSDPDDESECESTNSDESYINEDDSANDEDVDNDDDDDDDDEDEEDGDNENLLDEMDIDYMSEAVNLLETHAEVNTDNAIAINLKLQDMLETVRRKIISMLNKCHQKYVENQEKIANPTQVSASLRSIGNCGYPFFKDGSGRPCPPNPDYTYRSEVEKEFFPSDLALFPHFVWTATDKLGILQGIKEQAIEHVERKVSYPSTSSGRKDHKIIKNVKLHSLKLTDLLDNVDDDFTIDWNQISIYSLKSRHTANSCFALWNVYLKPDINRDAWTEEENMKLNSLAKKYKFQDWIAIAAEMKGRSDYQCFVQYQTVVSQKMREDKGERWTKEEDELLLSLVEKHRMGNVIRWNPICSQLPNRTKQQCFARYKYGINPSILRAPFTQEEDCIILAAVEEYGENFTLFPKALFPNRTVVQIRNRYNNSIKYRESTRSWTPADDKLLLQLVAKHGKTDWKLISTQIESHSRTSCRTRFLVISKFLKENPNATIQDLPRKNRKPLSSVTKLNWVNKITEIKQNPEPVAKPTKREDYRFRLRRQELKWYNCLKFSYDFKFGKGYSKAPASLAGLEFVRNALDIHVQLPITLNNPYARGIVRVCLEKLARLHGEDNKFAVADIPYIGYRLPPSYCTMLAFRGLCILTASCEEASSSTSDVKMHPDVHIAKDKFRQRLNALLYRTALLSRLEPENVVATDHFEVIFHHDTQSGEIANRSMAELKVVQMNNIAENILIATRKAKRKSSVLGAPSSSPESKLPKIAPE